MTSQRCHFDSSGWLRGPIAITHLMTPNRYNSGFAVHGKGVVQHTEAGYEAGTVETFMNPASQVSAFFSIAESGSCHQYLPVGQGFCAWSQGDGNTAWRGIEDEDRTDPAVPMTAAQITTFAQILEALSVYDGFPLQVTDDVNGTGLITHGDGGVAWGNHPNCPGDVRKAQRPEIVRKALEIRAAVLPPPFPPGRYTANGSMSLAQLAARQRTEPADIIWATAQGDPKLAIGPLQSRYFNAGDWSALMPSGMILYLP